MAFCPYCGGEIDEDYKFCAACGANLPTRVASIKDVKPKNEVAMQEETKPRPKNSDIRNIISSLVGLVVIFVGGYFLLTLIPELPEQRGFASIAEVKDLISGMTKVGLMIVAVGALDGFVIGWGVKGVIQSSKESQIHRLTE